MLPSYSPAAADTETGTESPERTERGGTRLDDETLQLARRLMRCTSRSADRALANGEAVLLDMEHDGIRCLLIALAKEDRPQHSLSPREQEIVRMISCGYPNKTVAVVLDISTWTVATHLRRIFAKLGVHNRAAMVARAIELRLVSPPGPRLSGSRLPPYLTVHRQSRSEVSAP